MKTINKRSWIVVVFSAVMLAVLALLGASMCINASDYALNPVNAHLYTRHVLLEAGRVLDRNGKTLAETVDRHRVYPSDLETRKSTLHVVGDPYGYIATGVQTTFRAELSGYSLVRGVPSEDEQKPDLTLTIDARSCVAARQSLGYNNGTVVVYNYKTGELLCETSAPYYDPENIPGDLLTNTDMYEGVFMNRALRGLYVPGSVFKIVTLCAALENIPDVESRTFFCEGERVLSSGTVICTDHHGEQTLKEAFGNSCNCVFSVLAEEIGAQKLVATAERLGLLSEYEIDRGTVLAGSMDLEDPTDAELCWAGIGQNKTMINPTSMMILCGAIAGGGKAVMPYYVKSVKNDLMSWYSARTKRTDELMSPAIAEKLKEYMYNNGTNYYGSFGLPELNICAKTGTAETGDGKQPHAWLVGFCDDPEHPYAFAAVVENAGSGRYYAGNAVAAALMPLL
ncbi:MAG: penicillin-binding protein [Clostridia bacterium]|nr:penicillin-binding protein [Clostridia bacterium]